MASNSTIPFPFCWHIVCLNYSKIKETLMRMTLRILHLFCCFQSLTAQDFWTQSNGPEGGRVTTIHVGKNNVLFAGTRGAGVFRSDDLGGTWYQFLGGVEAFRVNAIASYKDRFFYVGLESGLICSNNSGQTWNQVLDGEIQSVAVNSLGHAFASRGGDLYRSTDMGQTWEKKLVALYRIVLRIGPNDELYALSENGLYLSIDNGENWSKLYGYTHDIYSSSMAISEEGVVFCGGLTEGLLRSTDRGGTWTSIGFEGFIVYAVGVSPDGNLVAAVYDYDYQSYLFRSTDGGGTWNTVHNWNGGVITALEFLSNDVWLAATWERGVWASLDSGASWSESSIGLFCTEPDIITADIHGNVYAAARSRLFMSADDGESWTSLDSALESVFILSILAEEDGTIYIGSTRGILRSTDFGGSWLSLNNGLTDTGVTHLVRKPGGDLFAGTYSAGVFRSSDNGGTWEQTNSGLSDHTIKSLAVSPNDEIFVGTFDGMYKSIDNGTTWEHLWFDSGQRPTTVVFDSHGHIYTWIESGGSSPSLDGVHRSDDNGLSWVHIFSRQHLIEGYLTVNGNGTIYVGYPGEVWPGPPRAVVVSTDKGLTWESMDAGLTNPFPKSMVTNSRGYVFMGTYQGVFRSFHTTTSTPGVYGTSPTSFRLRQNYPNPFNPSTTIGFSLPRSGEVSLKIFNPLGEEVATLTSGHMDAGVHSIEWNATGQPSGVYFYRLQAGSCAETRKLVLVR
jgi:photosystem II stability/assembly factor-like uncharacterized protein